jgi:hypothetical protein
VHATGCKQPSLRSYCKHYLSAPSQECSKRYFSRL